MLIKENASVLSPRLKQLMVYWRPIIEKIENNHFSLELAEDHVQLVSVQTSHQKPFWIDFLSGSNEYRRKIGGGRSQLIAKAIGIKQGKFPTVLDGTGGLGKDAFVLASLGCIVDVVERSPIVALLLRDACDRAQQDDEIGEWVKNRFRVHHADSKTFINNFDEEVEVIYLDPMYPKKKKEALVKQEMRILKELVGDDQDADALLEAALQKAQQKVVVKRPNYAEPLANRVPNQSFEGKKNRFDLYLTGKI